MNIIDYAPLVNLILIIGGGLVFVTRINDVLKNVMAGNEKLTNTVTGIDRRLTVVETMCAINHDEQHRKRTDHRASDDD